MLIFIVEEVVPRWLCHWRTWLQISSI